MIHRSKPPLMAALRLTAPRNSPRNALGNARRNAPRLAGWRRWSQRGLSSCLRATATLLALPLALLLPFEVARAEGAEDLKGYGQTISSPQQQQELDYGTGGPRSSSILDATNPIDLMNRLRRATALDDATQPRDAIDAALRDFDGQSARPGAAPTKGP